MRDAILVLVMGLLLVIALARPFVGVLLFSWISFMSPHKLSWGAASGLPFAMLAFLATMAGMVLAREPRALRVTAIMVMLVVFALAITATSAVALGPPAEVWAKWEETIKIIVALLLVGALLTERMRIHALVWMMALSLGFFGVTGGLSTIFSGGTYVIHGPPESMIADRNHVAVGLLFAIPLMNWLRLHSAQRLVRLGLIVAMVLTLFAAIGTQSRGALVSLVAIAGLLWLRTPGKIVSGFAIAVAVAGVITFMPQSWVDRMTTIQTFEEDGSAMGRVTIWQAAWQVAVARPATGGGFKAVYHQGIVDQYAPGIVARATHSIYFEVIGEHGFVVFGLWLAMIATGVFYTFSIISLSRNRPELAWAGDLARMAQVSIAAYMVGGTFLSLAYWDLFWTLIVMLGATRTVVQLELAAAGRADRGAQPGWRARPAPA